MTDNKDVAFAVGTLIASGFFTGMFIANIVEYNKIVKSETLAAATTKGEAQTLLWVNIIGAIIAVALLIWAIVQLWNGRQAFTGPAVATVVAPAAVAPAVVSGAVPASGVQNQVTFQKQGGQTVENVSETGYAPLFLKTGKGEQVVGYVPKEEVIRIPVNTTSVAPNDWCRQYPQSCIGPNYSVAPVTTQVAAPATSAIQPLVAPVPQQLMQAAPQQLMQAAANQQLAQAMAAQQLAQTAAPLQFGLPGGAGVTLNYPH